MNELLNFLKKYNEEKKDGGFIPSVEMLIEDIENGEIVFGLSGKEEEGAIDTLLHGKELSDQEPI